SVVIENGQMLKLAPGRAEIVDEAPSGRLHLDGRIMVSEDDGFARSRRALGFAGFIGITLVVNRKGKLAADPVLHLGGIPDDIHGPVAEAVERVLQSRRSDDMKEDVRRAARRAAQDIWGKKPVVRVEIVEI